MKHINLEPLHRLLTDEIDPVALARVIDESAREYSGFALKSKELCGAPWIADNLFTLYQLRNALLEASGINVLKPD